MDSERHKPHLLHTPQYHYHISISFINIMQALSFRANQHRSKTL